MPPEPLLAVSGLAVQFRGRRGPVRAVDGVDLALAAGETLALVGESGSGKSTTGLALMGLVPAAAGRVTMAGADLRGLSGGALKAHRRRLQMVFQDPYASLNPRQRVRDILQAPLDIHGIGSRPERRERVAGLMARVGLRPDQAAHYPHQLSGGQRQRVGIARALALAPALVICDEPVSALDLSVQAQILNLLAGLQRDLGLAYLFISHDLGVVAHIAHRVAVMYRGRIVETAPRDALFAAPRHPYTELLLASVPVAHPRDRRPRAAAADERPAAPGGCAFLPRCPLATDRCRQEAPMLTGRDDGWMAACHQR